MSIDDIVRKARVASCAGFKIDWICPSFTASPHDYDVYVPGPDPLRCGDCEGVYVEMNVVFGHRKKKDGEQYGKKL